MKIDKEGLAFIKEHEGVILHAYKDVVGVWTIGIDCTYFPDGTPVKEGDTITQTQCDDLFLALIE